MTIPASPSASQYDAQTDDPKQARAQFLAHQQAYLQTLAFQGGEMGSLTATDAGTLDVDSVDAGTIYVAAQAGSPSPVVSSLGTPTRGAPWKTLVFEAGITLQHGAGSLELPGGANILTEDGDSAVAVYDTVGSPAFWRVISYQRAALAPGLPPLLHVRDEKASGTDAGTFTSGARRTRDLNAVKTNEIPGASLGSNQFTLPLGRYWCDAMVPAVQVNRHKAWLRNVTDGTDALVGTSAVSSATAPHDQHSIIRGEFTIAAAKTFEIQHLCQTSVSTLGFGQGWSTSGSVEVYTEVMIRKVG